MSRELAAEHQIHPALCTCGCPLHQHRDERNPDRLICENAATCGCTGWESSTAALREGRF